MSSWLFMNIKQITSVILFFFLGFICTYGQSGTIQGTIVNKLTNEPVPFAPVILSGTTIGTTSGEDGTFEMKGLKPGVYNLEVAVIGFKRFSLFDLEIRPTKITRLKIELEEELRNLNEVEIKPTPFVKIEEAPVSIHTIGVVEIKRNPGGSRDISKALQSLPGVAATASFRNDLVIRGGSSNENRFYMDGVEVPNINHFSTQGATGGPAGMINVDFIREVDFYSGAFPASRGNALSSVLDFKLKDGRDDKMGYSFTLGASDLAATAEGPVSKKTTFTASWRRSYLQFLFKALGLPFLPKYDDFLVKGKVKLDTKNEITIIGLGAMDDVTLNLAQDETEFQQYLLGNLPENKQWSYTGGVIYKHYQTKGYYTLVFSRNELNNKAFKYKDNDPSDPANLILDYNSSEQENKIRMEHTSRMHGFKIVYGLSGETALYKNTTFNQVPFVGAVNYNSEINFIKYGAFTQVSTGVFGNKLDISLGLRVDGNTYTNSLSNPLNQFSPRLSISYPVTDRFRINANTGRYHQLPAYTILGYRNSSGSLVNRGVSYIRCWHYVGGIEYTTPSFLRVTVEGFLKNYSRYPFDLRDSISIANQGSDFGVVGTVPVRSDNKGRAYGAEVLVQQKLNHNVYGILSYSFVRSEFEDYNGRYIPASWDYQHILSVTAGKYLKKNWEIGARFRFNSGSPYTPYQLAASMEKSNFDITGQGILDKQKLNTLRTEAFHQLDVRVDKKYFFRKWSLNLYLDIQNIYNSKTTLSPYLSVKRDAAGKPLTDSASPGSYLPDFIPNESGSVIPTIGIILEF
ncbi:MAG TPA: TonB-dependent receptor [Bacteroidia bacterium]|nr:TonB-dependent receptor [Bacteroidia bacterium]